MSTTSARWPRATAENPCPICGHKNACKIAPDGNAAACWHDGHAGKVIQLAHANGSSSSDNGHVRMKSKSPPTPGKAFCTIAEATAAALKLAEKNSGQSASPGGQWIYRSADDEPRDLMAVLRFDLSGGDKAILPLKSTKGGGWAIGDPPEPLPLYRLPELADGDTVFISEGEKAALAAASIGLTTTTSSHGASSASRTNWKPLAGRSVVILPDNDAAGEGYARDVSRILLKLEPPARVKIVRLPGLPTGGDVVEFIADRRPADNDAIREEIEKLADAVPALNSADVLGGPVLVCAADVEAREVRWLWQGRFPLGRISLLVGKPGEGKSFLTTDMASRVSTGTPWPDGSDCPMGSVILVSAEDDPADTIKPRLDAHRADCRRIHLLSAVRRIDADGKPVDVMFTLADLPALEAALKSRPDCRLVIVDPIGSFLGGDTDAHRDNEVRGVLAPVARLAEKYGPAVLVVAHRRKGTASNSADDLALGSRAFTGIARAVWHLSRDQKNKTRRLLLPGKNNLAPEGDGLAFAIAGDPPAIMWERGRVAMSADDALAIENSDPEEKPGPAPDTRDMAGEWLTAELADLQEHPVATLKEAAETAGVGSWKTVQRAATQNGVLSHRATFGGGYVWRLPKPGAVQDTMRDSSQGKEITCPPVPHDGNTGNNDDSAGQVPLQDRIIPLGTQGENGGAK